MEGIREKRFENNKEKKDKNIFSSLFGDLFKKSNDSKKDSFFNLFKDLFAGKTDNFFGRLFDIFKNKENIISNTKRKTHNLRDSLVGGVENMVLKEIKEKETKSGFKKIAIFIAENKGIPPDIFINLITKENKDWNPKVKNPKSSAFGLGQMISSTWEKHGNGLNKNNPTHQLIATANYLEYIKKKNNCSWEEATAFYNTGEGFNKDSSSPVPYNYIRGNLKSIVWKIPGLHGKSASSLKGTISKKQYFIAATAYYSGKSYNEVA